MGPIDGHDIGMMCEALETAKSLGAPVLLHVNTVKGKGYNYAEKDPSHFHGVSDFDRHRRASFVGRHVLQ